MQHSQICCWNLYSAPILPVVSWSATFVGLMNPAQQSVLIVTQAIFHYFFILELYCIVAFQSLLYFVLWSLIIILQLNFSSRSRFIIAYFLLENSPIGHIPPLQGQPNIPPFYDDESFIFFLAQFVFIENTGRYLPSLLGRFNVLLFLLITFQKTR